MNAKSLLKHMRMDDKMSARTLYLADGGLIDMLKRAPTKSKVWLYKKDGKWTYTFSKAIEKTTEDGVVIPTVDLDNGKVIEVWEDTVVAFLLKLGLSEKDAGMVFSVNRKE